MSVLVPSILTGTGRTFGLEPMMGKIASRYGVSVSYRHDPVRYVLYVSVGRNAVELPLDRLRELREAGDYDVIWNMVENACRELTDEMSGLYALADEVDNAPKRA